VVTYKPPCLISQINIFKLGWRVSAVKIAKGPVTNLSCEYLRSGREETRASNRVVRNGLSAMKRSGLTTRWRGSDRLVLKYAGQQRLKPEGTGQR
jgi:hypothetical protein